MMVAYLKEKQKTNRVDSSHTLVDLCSFSLLLYVNIHTTLHSHQQIKLAC